uniref:UBX domain-containing protein n=1 Tax=Phaeomonas parva TaxID=124430 RepID=A0A7S1U7C7_9STRA|mmetsp:Transcript_34482/g.108587  ORF Transcript_34482/g.108587 Transcript_34482/m.108587 type:complete len:346 (+) Transcript_34482:251-1288(+)
MKRLSKLVVHLAYAWSSRRREAVEAQAQLAALRAEAAAAAGDSPDSPDGGDGKRSALDVELKVESARAQARAEADKRPFFSLLSARRSHMDTPTIRRCIATAMAKPRAARPSALDASAFAAADRPGFSIARVPRVSLPLSDVAAHLPADSRASETADERQRPRPRPPVTAAQSLREEQDAAFAASLATDRERARLWEEEMAELALRQELAEEREAVFQVTVAEADAELAAAPEPDGRDGVTRIQVLAPQGRFRRRFRTGDTLALLRAYLIVAVRPEAPAWTVVDSVTRRPVMTFRKSALWQGGDAWAGSGADAAQTLAAAQLAPSATLLLTEEEAVEEEDVDAYS